MVYLYKGITKLCFKMEPVYTWQRDVLHTSGGISTEQSLSFVDLALMLVIENDPV